MTPDAIIIERLPAAAKESVQPWKGSYNEQIMIDGLRIRTGTLPLFFSKALSLKFFVKV